MSNEPSSRTLLAIFCLLAAGFLGLNEAVQGSALSEWALPLVLFIMGMALLAWEWFLQRTAVEGSELALSSNGAMSAEEMTGSKPATKFATDEIKPGREQDNLQKIEGIGPKMAIALQTAGIDTFEKLSKATEDQLRAAVQAAAMRFAPSIPTWAEQARYAAQGDWAGLAAFQEKLVGGRKAD